MTTRNLQALLLITIGSTAACDRGFLHNLPPAEPPLCGPAPTELSAIIENDQVVLRWTSALTAAEAFLIERSAAGGDWAELTRVDGAARSHTDTQIQEVGRYEYRVRGVRGPCTTDPSTAVPVFTTPLPPTDVAAVPEDAHSILLTWRDPNGFEAGYAVQRRATGETDFTAVVSSTGPDVERYLVSGLRADTVYELQVAAVRQGGGTSSFVAASSWSGPGTPTDLVVTTISPSQLDLAWSAVANPHLTGFRIDRRRPGYGQFQTIATLGSSARAHQDSGLEPGATYDYQVYAVPGAPDASPAAASGTTSGLAQLAWGAAPTLDSTCTLHVAASCSFDSSHGAAFRSASASVSHAHGAIVADASGFAAPLIDPAATTLTTSWSVLDTLGGTSTLTRDLLLVAVTPGLLHTQRTTPLAARGDSPGDGQQWWVTSREAPPAGRCGTCGGRIGALALADHSCALVDDGRVRCWGRNGSGQVGDGSQVEQRFPAPVCASGSYAQLNCVQFDDAVALASGEAHTCALRGTGQVSCWGANASGRLGDGTITNQLNPTTVCLDGSVPGTNCTPLTGAAAIAAGNRHSCALLTTGRVLCWGNNDNGQLGNGAAGWFQGSANPRWVCATGSTTSGDCGWLTDVVALTSGAEHSCAIVGAGGVQCWGANGQGQLGAGESSTFRHHPAAVCASGSAAQGNCVPLAGAIGLAAGIQHTCALLADGSVHCWGPRDQAGDGDGLAALFAVNPVPVCLSGSAATANCTPLGDAIAIATGYWHACALRASGQVVCWGRNQAGALGNGEQGLFEVRRNPVTVCRSGSTSAGDCVPLDRVVAVAAGDQYSCASLDDGQLQCWGNGGEGQLGDPRGGSGYTSNQPGDVCLTTVNNLCVQFDDAAMRRCVELVVEVAP